MNFVTCIMAVFSLVGAADRIFGNCLGLGKEFERGLMMLGVLALSMTGMLVMAPLLVHLLSPALVWMSRTLPIDPSFVPAMIFANDMGGAKLAMEVAQDAQIGAWNGMVVSSMMGVTVSFTIPFALSTVKKEQQGDMLLGLLCGIVTIPAGCLIGGLIAGVPLLALLINLLPLILISLLISFGLIKAPRVCVLLFRGFGWVLKALITVGLAVGLLEFLTGFQALPYVDSFENAGAIIWNAAAVLTGAFPLLAILARLLRRPLRCAAKRFALNETSVMGFFATFATSVTTFETMESMDRLGVVLNSAFAVSAICVFADHLAYTLAVRAEYLAAMVIGKLTAAVLAVVLANAMYQRSRRREMHEASAVSESA